MKEYEFAYDLLEEEGAEPLALELGEPRLSRLERLVCEYSDDLSDEGKKLMARAILATEVDLGIIAPIEERVTSLEVGRVLDLKPVEIPEPTMAKQLEARDNLLWQNDLSRREQMLVKRSIFERYLDLRESVGVELARGLVSGMKYDGREIPHWLLGKK